MTGYSIDIDPVRKRYCRAARAFNPGQIVLTEEAYESVVDNDHCSVYCHQTLTSRGDLLR